MAFTQAVSAHMATDVITVSTEAMLPEVARLLEVRRPSAVPVVNADGRFAGVITRSELLHAGRVERGARRGGLELVLPEMKVESYLSKPPQVCSPSTPLRDAARMMVDARVHRLIVLDDDRVAGLISTQHLVQAVRDARLTLPLCEVTHRKVATLAASGHLFEATVLLERSIEGVVLLHGRWPVGVFTPLDALATRWMSPELPAIDACDRAIAVMPDHIPLFHAAAIAAQLDVTRVISMREGEVTGLASGLDIARVVAA